MLKRFDAVVMNLYGKPMTKGPDDKDLLTVADAIIEALGTPYEDERALSGEEKLKRYVLAERILSTGATPTEVSAENLALIKMVVAKRYPAFVVGFVFKYLEGKDSEADAKLPASRRSATLAAVAGAKG